MPTYIKTFGDPRDPKEEIHLEGTGDSYTLCGTDTAGDPQTHYAQPKFLRGLHRVTCAHCLDQIARVKEHLNLPKS